MAYSRKLDLVGTKEKKVKIPKKFRNNHVKKKSLSRKFGPYFIAKNVSNGQFS